MLPSEGNNSCDSSFSRRLGTNSDVTLTLTRPTNKPASSSRAVKLTGMAKSNSGSLSLTSVTTMLTVVVDV